jgi:DNA-binding transcriptional LysR family regulator
MSAIPKSLYRTPLSTPLSLLGVDLLQLETFIAVAEAGSFSSAAQRLCVTQPAVTGRLQRLEATLGTELLRRTTRKVETTPQGARLLAQANEVLNGLRGLVDEFRHGKRLARQRVVVAATPMLAAIALPVVIKDYAQHYPDVGIELLDLQYADALAAVDSGAADFALLSLGSEAARYRFEPVRTVDMVLVAPAGHPLAGCARIELDEVVHHTITIIEQYRSLCARFDAALKTRGLGPMTFRTVANVNTLLGMLDAGMGITLLPRTMAQRGDAANRTVIDVAGIDLRRTFGIVLACNAELSTAADSFRRFIRQAMTT